MAIAKGLAIVVALPFFSCLVTISEGMWCVANPQISDVFLKRETDRLCANGGINYIVAPYCKKIRSGGPCFRPNTVKFHASVVFNAYASTHADPRFCLNGRALWSFVDPSTKTCKFYNFEEDAH